MKTFIITLFGKLLCRLNIHDFESSSDLLYNQATKKYTHKLFTECKRCKLKQYGEVFTTPKYHKAVLFGKRMTKTATRCLVCHKPLNRKPGQFSFFCCKAHRKLFRGGKHNVHKYGSLKDYIYKTPGGKWFTEQKTGGKDGISKESNVTGSGESRGITSLENKETKT